MKVWIDQDLCTGDGLCEEIAPDVFTLLDDGLAYVKEGSKVFNAPGGADGLANIPDGQLANLQLLGGGFPLLARLVGRFGAAQSQKAAPIDFTHETLPSTPSSVTTGPS